MSNLVLYPDIRLRTPCAPVSVFDGALRELGAELILAAQEARGMAVAAPQLQGCGLVSVFAYSVDGREGVVVNPRVMALSDDRFMYHEGCLSLPGRFWWVSRPMTVTISYQDTDGVACVLTDDSVMGRMLQHEVDHLNGVLIVDHLTLHEKKKLAKELAV